MKPQTYSAVIRQDNDWWIGRVEEIPGVNRRDELAPS